MNTRSLSFRLVAWYGGLLAMVFLLLGTVTFAAVVNDLQASLRKDQARRARQIADTLLTDSGNLEPAALERAVESLYAPEANDRFIRITRDDGRVAFRSGPPRERGFDPSLIRPTRATPGRDSWRKVSLPDGAMLVIASRNHRGPDGSRYLVEVGASTAGIDATIDHLLTVMVAGFPVAMLLAVVGGFFLVRRALAPADAIAQKAEAITQHNLSERLPVSRTGDEIERLSVALNHMISRLEEAVQGSKRFVADASHELRTPLTVLRGEIESLMTDRRLTVHVRDTLGSLLEEVDRLAAVVEGLLALSRLDAGEARSEWVRFDFAELVTSTADQMSLLAEDKGIAVNCYTPRPVMVDGDRARMKQVVVNLLDNALKYTPHGGSVRLRVELEDGQGAFEVSDTGPGIPSEALPHVFKRFFRVECSRTREQGGAGLGLSIVQSICTAHGAVVDVHSSPGLGSRFRIRLPLAAPGQVPSFEPRQLAVT